MCRQVNFKKVANKVHILQYIISIFYTYLGKDISAVKHLFISKQHSYLFKFHHYMFQKLFKELNGYKKTKMLGCLFNDGNF